MLVALALLVAVAAPGTERIAGRWEGAIEVLGGTLGIAVDFKTAADGWQATIDIPQQGAQGLALTAVRVEPPKVHFELPAGPGLAVFDGELADGVIRGSFRQAGVEGSFELTPGTPKPEATPEPPPPYKVEEVVVTSGEVKLAGTLTLPPKPGKHPAVVLLTGSGAQNRDEEIAGFKPFRLIADHLTRAGVVVLRCDDRGVGSSSGSLESVTSEDLAGDALAALGFLKSRPEVDSARIGLLGHSEGGLLAVMAAGRSKDVGFIVLVSGPAVNGETLLRAQGEAIFRAEGKSEAEVQRLLAQQARGFRVIRTGEGAEELAAEVRKETLAALAKLPPEQQKAMGDLGPFADRAVKGQMAALRSPWLKFFLDFDPTPALGQVRCPVLALFGEKDLQVPAEPNRKALEAALARTGNKRVTVKVLPGANHLFQAAKTGSPSEYAMLPKQFVPGFLEAIAGFVTAKR